MIVLRKIVPTKRKIVQEMVATLEECNRALSQELGFDFASAAAPPSCCG